MSTSKTKKSGKVKQFNFIPYNPRGQPSESSAEGNSSDDSETWNEPTTWIFLQIILGIHLKLKHANPKNKNEIWKHTLILFKEQLVSQKAANDTFINALTIDKLQNKWDTLRNQYLDLRRNKENNTKFIYYEEIEQICKYDPEIILEADANGSVILPEVDLERDEKLADARCVKNNVRRIPAFIIHTRILEPSDAEYTTYGTYSAANPPQQQPQPQESKTRLILPATSQNGQAPQGNSNPPPPPPPQQPAQLPPPPVYRSFDDETEMLSTCIRGFFQHAEGVSIQMMRAYREDMKQSLKRMEHLFEENTRKRKAEFIEVMDMYEQRRRKEQEDFFKRIEKMYKGNKSQ